ncbi:MAG: hypothetical protein Q4G28_01350 [Neisseria sp.]|nr:hypothetical protein [Neisseria sp.]
MIPASAIPALLAAVLFTATVHAADLSGEYRPRPCGEPTGCGAIILQKDGSYAAVGFGYVQIGRWQQQNQSLLLTPYNPSLPFSAFGRHNPDIKAGRRIAFEGAFAFIYAGQSPSNVTALDKFRQECPDSDFAWWRSDARPFSLFIQPRPFTSAWPSVRYDVDFKQYNDIIIRDHGVYQSPMQFELIRGGFGTAQDDYDTTYQKFASLDDWSPENQQWLRHLTAPLAQTAKASPAYRNPNHWPLLPIDAAATVEDGNLWVDMNDEGRRRFNRQDYRFDKARNAYLLKNADNNSADGYGYYNRNIIYRYEPLAVKAVPSATFDATSAERTPFQCFPKTKQAS